MKTPAKLLIAFAAGLGVAALSIYLYDLLFTVLHKAGVAFDTPYSENPFHPFERYRTLMAVLTGVLTTGLLLAPRLAPRRASTFMLVVWVLSWGVLLLDAFIRSLSGPPTFALQLHWYLLPTLSMAATFAAVLCLLLLVVRRRQVATR